MNLSAKIDTFLETLLWGGPIKLGPGLPQPIERKPGRPVETPKSTGRLVNPVTMTYEWDVARARPANASADLTDMESEELKKRGLKNTHWNAAVKLARVQGKTIAEAAKVAGCGFSTAQKIYAALSRFE